MSNHDHQEGIFSPILTPIVGSYNLLHECVQMFWHIPEEHGGAVVECLTRDRGVAVQASPEALHCVFAALRKTLYPLLSKGLNPGRPI